MPRKPIDFSKCIIYHFVCHDISITDSYVGHTTDFRKRKNSHKSVCCNETNKNYNLKLYRNIRATGGWSNWTMTPLEQYPCENDIQARIREQYWMDKLQAKMNKHKAFTTEEERSGYFKEYREKHKEEIAEKGKIYYEENKDKIKEYQKQYNEEHKDENSEKRKEKYNCACGSVCSIRDKTTHFKTQKHINSMANV